uniref:Uncharacterized protein n=1 Tax=Alexandrium monilatum TaxID=311494 RepID=A0A7S4RKM3_9DINO
MAQALCRQVGPPHPPRGGGFSAPSPCPPGCSGSAGRERPARCGMPRANFPGPGAYDVNDSFRQSSRGVTLRIGGRSDHLEQEPLPGPSDYVPMGVGSKVAARCKFGTSKRFGRPNKDGPGPAEYSPRDPMVVSERKTIGERNGTLPLVTPTSTPGPGSYTPSRVREAPGCAANFARSSKRLVSPPLRGSSLDSPGPAAYQHEVGRSVGRRTPAVGFGTSPTQRLQSQDHTGKADSDRTPGPGSYTWELKPYGPKISITPRRPIEY